MTSFQTCRLAASTILLALFLSACGNKQPGRTPSNSAANQNIPLPDPPMVSTCDPGIPGGRVVIAIFSEPKTFNPITSSETSSSDIYYRLFHGLVVVDSPTEKPLPGFAQSWSVEPDNKTWTFHLRKGLRWSDGEPLTADDVVFTWNDIIFNTNIVNVTRDQFTIDKKPFVVTKIDDLTVRVVTPQIFAPFLEFFGPVAIMPKHKLEKAVKDGSFLSAYSVNTKPEDIVCNGPFRIKEYKSGQYILLERNPYYWEVDTKGQRLPYLDNVIYEILPDMNTMSLRFLNGEADLQELVRPDEYDHFAEEADKGHFKVLDLGPAAEHDCLTFNENPGKNPKTGKPYVDPVKLKWFQQTKFRQAISYALDRDAIVKSAFGGHGAPRYGFINSAATNWFNPNIMKYPHDPQKALALLAEIGIKRRGDGTLADSDGNPIQFIMNSNAGNDRRQKTGVVIQEDLQQLGIQVTFQPLDFNAVIDKMENSFDFDCILLGWAGGPADPDFSMNIMKSDSFDHEWYPQQKTPATPEEARMDELMNKQLTTLDHAERKKYFDEVQAILAEQMYMIPTASMEHYSAIRDGLENVRGTTLDPNPIAWNLEELYWKKK